MTRARAAAWPLLMVTLITLCSIPTFITPIGDDQGYFLYCADRLLNHDPMVFVFNLPTMYYFFAPAVWIARLMGCSQITGLNLFLLLLALLSIGLCGRILRELPISTLTRRGILLVLPLLLLLYPTHGFFRNDFGEREHLLFIMTLPYILAAGERRRRSSLPVGLRSATVILAAAGLVLKPIYPLLWIIIETWIFFSQPRGRRRMRPEGVLLGLILAASAGAVLAIFPGTMAMLQLASRTYGVFGSPAGSMIRACGPPLIAVLFALSAPRDRRQLSLSPVLVVATLCFLALALVQGNNWFYHFYPAYASAAALLITVALDLRDQSLAADSCRTTPAERREPLRPARASSVTVGACSCLGMLLIIRPGAPPWFAPMLLAIYAPLCAVILWCVAEIAESDGRLSSETGSALRRITSLLLLCLASLEILRALAFGDAPDIDLILLPAVFGVAFTGAAAQKNALTPRASGAILALCATALIVLAALNALGAVRLASDAARSPEGRLAQLVRDNDPRREIYVFSTSPSPTFPLVNETGTRLGPHFSCLSYLPALYTAVSPTMRRPYHTLRTMSSLERSVVDGVVADLQNMKPDVLIFGGYGATTGFGSSDFDFIAYFSQDPRFRLLWRRYHLLESVAGCQVYELHTEQPRRIRVPH